jgi:hypothetical protein
MIVSPLLNLIGCCNEVFHGHFIHVGFFVDFVDDNRLVVPLLAKNDTGLIAAYVLGNYVYEIFEFPVLVDALA